MPGVLTDTDHFMPPFGQTTALLHLFLCGLCGATKVRVFPKQLEMRVDMNSGFDNERPGICRDRNGYDLRRQARIACWSGCRLILDQPNTYTPLPLARPRAPRVFRLPSCLPTVRKRS